MSELKIVLIFFFFFGAAGQQAISQTLSDVDQVRKLQESARIKAAN